MANETYHPRGVLVHGYRVRQHPLYATWADMKCRCRNENEPGYVNYGGRGVTYCDRWKHFANFAEDMYPTYVEGLTIERKDNSLGYSPKNCCWEDRTQQCLNRRNFKNNSTDFQGINQLPNGTFMARYCAYEERYNLGRFETAEQARDYREKFIALLETDREAALKMTERRVRLDAASGVRGITVHKGGLKFVVRKTVNGKRIYLGSSSTLEGAKAVLEKSNV